jgi:hypothetical protein
MSLWVEPEVFEFFKDAAKGKGRLTLMQNVLYEFMKTLEANKC